MRSLVLAAALFAIPARSAAQRVPGRDLLHFPLGVMERPVALRGGIGDGLGNPAAVVLDSGSRARIGVAALQTPPDQGVAGQLLAAAVALPQRLTVGFSVARYTVDDIFRTDTDPQTVGGLIPYGTTVYSATLAQRLRPYLASGIAVRYRHGKVDAESRGALGLDAGVALYELPYRDASFGVASFLWQPANAEVERTAINLAGDLRLLGPSRLRQTRVGYGITVTEGGRREEFAVLSGRYQEWDARVGVARGTQYGRQDWRVRFAVGVFLDRYDVGVAREANGAGLAATYQFFLNATLR
jgi:hypothetical protein